MITSAARAKDLKQRPVLVRGASQGAADDQRMMTSFYRKSLTGLPEMGEVARNLYTMSGLGPEDMQAAVLYDHFSPFVLPQLEEFGFAERGKACDFLREGHHLRGGKLPVNPHGGQLGEAYIHGLNGVAEAVRQVRGDSTCQVKDVELSLAVAGPGYAPGSAVLFGRAA